MFRGESGRSPMTRTLVRTTHVWCVQQTRYVCQREAWCYALRPHSFLSTDCSWWKPRNDCAFHIKMNYFKWMETGIYCDWNSDTLGDIPSVKKCYPRTDKTDYPTYKLPSQNILAVGCNFCKDYFISNVLPLAVKPSKGTTYSINRRQAFLLLPSIGYFHREVYRIKNSNSWVGREGSLAYSK